MTLEELKATLSDEEILAIKSVAEKTDPLTKTEEDTFIDYLRNSSKALGEDQIAEPVRYIAVSMGGLRNEDLRNLIGEEFNPETFDQWNNLLGFPIFFLQKVNETIFLLEAKPRLKELLRKEMGENVCHSCASDIGYYLLEQKEPGDMVRDTQTLHLLLDGMEAAAAAEYISECKGFALQVATKVLANGMEFAPESVKLTITDLARAEGEKIDRTKIIIMLGAARLLNAQNARLQRNEEKASKTFGEAMNLIMPLLQNADHKKISATHIAQFWNCLKICQEMMQPKAMVLIFEQIIRIENAQKSDAEREETERGNIAEDIIGQHIDLSKVYYMMPKPLQEQFTNYTDKTLSLLDEYFKNDATSQNDAADENALPHDTSKYPGFYQAIGELKLRLEKYEESYDALTEAQILQMRQLAALQKQDGPDAMSQEQLICRLALSATNHMIAAYYRHVGKNQHDLGILLRSNMNLAEDCFKFYHRDPKVIHFIINAALELGDYQHNSRGILAECGTYEKVIRQFGVLNNMNLDQQLAVDIAMIQTKCGQVQADKTIRRYKEAIRNLETAYQLWNTMGEKTKNPTFQNNAKTVSEILRQLKGGK